MRVAHTLVIPFLGVLRSWRHRREARYEKRDKRQGSIDQPNGKRVADVTVHHVERLRTSQGTSARALKRAPTFWPTDDIHQKLVHPLTNPTAMFAELIGNAGKVVGEFVRVSRQCPGEGLW